MDEQKTQKTAELRKTPLKFQTDLWDKVHVVDAKPGEIEELTIDESFTPGGDPYNTTGRHVIVKLDKDTDE